MRPGNVAILLISKLVGSSIIEATFYLFKFDKKSIQSFWGAGGKRNLLPGKALPYKETYFLLTFKLLNLQHKWMEQSS